MKIVIRSKRSIALIISMVAFGAASASAIGSVTNGSVTFGYTANFNTIAGDTVDTQFVGAATGDQTWESWWFFRVAGDGRETAFGIPNVESYTGSVGRLDFYDPGGLGRFYAILNFEVFDTGAGMGNLFQGLSIYNVSGSVLDIDVFHYTDLDVGGSFGGDTASLVANPGGIQINAVDGASTAPMIGYGADAFRVTAWRALLNDLTDTGIDNFGNTGLPFAAGDFTAGFQWSTSIGAGSSESFVTQFGSNAPLLPTSVTSVPEPGTAILAGLGLMLLASGRRRS